MKDIMCLSEQLCAADRLIKGLQWWQHKSLSWMSSSDGCFAATSPNTQQSSAVCWMSQIRRILIVFSSRLKRAVDVIQSDSNWSTLPEN